MNKIGKVYTKRAWHGKGKTRFWSHVRGYGKTAVGFGRTRQASEKMAISNLIKKIGLR